LRVKGVLKDLIVAHDASIMKLANLYRQHNDFELVSFIWHVFGCPSLSNQFFLQLKEQLLEFGTSMCEN